MTSNVSEVYFFWPNLIGYSRIVLAAAAFAFAFESFQLFFFFYAASAALDMADGHAARYFNQVSRYGAVLDMVTDRCVSSPSSFGSRLDSSSP
jgi:CDP-diacylglycerol--inositol 3-phosphatidyltransferase